MALELKWRVRSYSLGHTVDLLTRMCSNEYMLRCERAIENNRFSKSLISRKTMQFLENWNIPSDAKWHIKCYDWVSTEGTQICGNYRDNGSTGHPLCKKSATLWCTPAVSPDVPDRFTGWSFEVSLFCWILSLFSLSCQNLARLSSGFILYKLSSSGCLAVRVIWKQLFRIRFVAIWRNVFLRSNLLRKVNSFCTVMKFFPEILSPFHTVRIRR